MKFAFLLWLLVCGIAFGTLPVLPGSVFFDNEQVKVMRALEKAHVKGKAHEHKVNRVMVYLQAGTQRFEYQDGRQPATMKWSAGQAVWSPADGFHSPEVTGDESFNIVEVELKNTGVAKTVAGSLDPVKIDPKHYTLEFENPQVRVVRVKIGAHESTPLHEHALNRVSVYLTDQAFQVTTAAGKADQVTHKAGDTVWATPLTHKEENTSDKPFESLMVEIKN